MNSPFYTGSRHSGKTWIWTVMRIFFHSEHFTAVSFAGGVVVKNPPAHAERQGTQARPLGQEGPLAEGTAPHSSVPACRVPRTEEPSGLQSTGSQVDMTECAHTHTHTHTPSTTASKGGWLWMRKPLYKVLGVHGANCKVIREFPTTHDISAPDSSVVGGSTIFSYWRKLISDSNWKFISSLRSFVMRFQNCKVTQYI